MLTVTYMSGGVWLHGGGYDIRLSNRMTLTILALVSMSGLPVKVEYTSQPIVAVAM